MRFKRLRVFRDAEGNQYRAVRRLAGKHVLIGQTDLWTDCPDTVTQTGLWEDERLYQRFRTGAKFLFWNRVTGDLRGYEKTSPGSYVLVLEGCLGGYAIADSSIMLTRTGQSIIYPVRWRRFVSKFLGFLYQEGLQWTK